MSQLATKLLNLSKHLFATPAAAKNSAMTITAALWVLFHVYTSGFGEFQPLVQRPVHVAFGLTYGFLAVLRFGDVAGRGRVWTLGNLLNLLGILAALAACLYVVWNEARLIVDFSIIGQTHEIVLGFALVVLLLEAARRGAGIMMPLFVLMVIAYTLFGQLIPGRWGHSGISSQYFVEYLYLGTEGIWGEITKISAGLIAIFVIFGSFLIATGATQTVLKLALRISGRSPGGGAKVANVASALFGTINGASVANCAMVGSVTIPAMIKLRYRRAFAGAVEAVSSTGGQITPPIMGAAAFVMAELLSISYVTVALAAVIPALLFYIHVHLSIDAEARRENMRPFDAADIPPWREVLNWHEAFPLAATVMVLLATLASGRTAQLAAFYGIITNLALFLLIGSWRREAFRVRLAKLLDGAKDSAKNMLTVVGLIVCAQIVVALIGMTGIGVKIAGSIQSFGEVNIFAAVLFAFFTSLVLGMGMPSTAAYLLAAAVCAPALIGLGIAPLTAHMFVFYGSILAGLTPPVCATVYVAAALTGTHWWPIAVESIKLALMKFALPFFFIYRGAVLLQGSVGEIAWTAAMGVVAAHLFAIAPSGFYRRPLNAFWRVLCGAAGIGLIAGVWYLDVLGIAVLATIIVWHHLVNQRTAAARAI